jgi:predicted DNA-binding protein (UPF0251 family)
VPRLLTLQACRDYERATRKHREVESMPASYDKPLAASQEYEVALGEILHQIVQDEMEAAVAMFVIYQGLTLRETAEELDVPRTTVYRVVTRLRDRAMELGVHHG